MPEPKVFNGATGQLVHGAAIADPSGGLTIDAEARTATNGILAALRRAAVIAGATQAPPATNVWSVGRVALGAAIANPAGGATIDADLRTAINSILTVLRGHGVIADGAAMPTHIVDEDTSTVTSAAIANLSTATGDAECRTAINSALAAMRSANLIAQD